MGGAFGLRLEDGRRVMLEAHVLRRKRRGLDAVHRAQRYLSLTGFPPPSPLVAPVPFGAGLASVEEFVDAGEYADAHRPEIRRAMARAYDRLVWLGAEFSGDIRGNLERQRLTEQDLWPPHNALFDFEATTAGTGWIDAISHRAKGIPEGSPKREVVGHSDRNASQTRCRGGEVRVIYDWDSLVLGAETSLVGCSAGVFTDTERVTVAPSSKPQEARLFVFEYEEARGEPFTREERAAVAAAITYCLGYAARREHAIDPEGEDYPGSRREALKNHGEEYLCL